MTRMIRGERKQLRLILMIVVALVGGCEDLPPLEEISDTADSSGTQTERSSSEEDADQNARSEDVTWVKIPGGTFEMGTDGVASERPRHSVSMAPFEMTKTEVTVAQFRRCVVDGGCTVPDTDGSLCASTGDYARENNWYHVRDEHPVNCLTWYQSKMFCEWAHGQLPSEAQWEYAARSAGQNVTYPWGEQRATCHYAVTDSVYDGCQPVTTEPVCSKPAGHTDHGLCDTAGNLSEWVQDCYAESYDAAPRDGTPRAEPVGYCDRVVRGGCFKCVGIGGRTTGRDRSNPDYGKTGIGFRCVR